MEKSLTRQDKVLISVLYSIEQLRSKGLISAPKRLSRNGLRIAMKLRSEGFEPTPQELECAMNGILDGADVKFASVC